MHGVFMLACLTAKDAFMVLCPEGLATLTALHREYGQARDSVAITLLAPQAPVF
jgi:hypothetical protein